MTDGWTTAGPPARRRRGDVAWLSAATARWSRFLALILVQHRRHAQLRHLQTLNVNLTQVCTIVIVGVGMTLVIATGGIDLSVGSLMAIAGALAPLIFLGKLFPLPHLGVGVALAFVVPVAGRRRCSAGSTAG